MGLENKFELSFVHVEKGEVTTKKTTSLYEVLTTFRGQYPWTCFPLDHPIHQNKSDPFFVLLWLQRNYGRY